MKVIDSDNVVSNGILRQVTATRRRAVLSEAGLILG